MDRHNRFISVDKVGVLSMQLVCEPPNADVRQAQLTKQRA